MFIDDYVVYYWLKCNCRVAVRLTLLQNYCIFEEALTSLPMTDFKIE
jgi:hypothetical protein